MKTKEAGTRGGLRIIHETAAAGNDAASPRISRPIPKGEPGSSEERPITTGTLRVNPGPGVTMNIYVRSVSHKGPVPEGRAPHYVVTSGDVYVFDGDGTVDIVFGRDGTVRDGSTISIIFPA